MSSFSAVTRPTRRDMVKQEEILNGDSVLYADPMAYEMSLHGAFARESARCRR